MDEATALALAADPVLLADASLAYRGVPGKGAESRRQKSAAEASLPAAALLASRRPDVSAELRAGALTQARLREHAASKLDPADAARMLFTDTGLQQATRASVAAHRASRLAAALPTGAAVIDLCCGIGGDLVALARAGCAVSGVDSDPATAAVASFNISALNLARRARVICADATSFPLDGAAAITCDPARRTGRGRVFNPDAYQPSWAFVEGLLRGDSCVKLAPGLPHERIPAGVEAEWVSDGGEVKEAALWSGRFCAVAARRATLLPGGHTITDLDDPGAASIGTGEPGRFLLEPDAAVIRAGLVTAVAAGIGGWLLDSSLAYISTDLPVGTPFATRYEVIGRLRFDERVLRGYVRSQGIGRLTIKKRGVDVVPEKLRRALRPRGVAEATFVITRVHRKATVLVVRPVAAAEQTAASG